MSTSEGPSRIRVELVTPEGPVFYDINANSNLRAPIAEAFGFDPFERVVDFLVAQRAAIKA